MKIRDYEKWTDDNYVQTERFAKKAFSKKMKKLDVSEEESFVKDKKRLKKK